MQEIVKNFFTPTERNGGVPTGLSRYAFYAYFVIAALLVIPAQYFYLSQLASLAKPASYGGSDVLVLLNQARAQAGLKELTLNDKLAASASGKLDDMLAYQYFAHMSPQSKMPWAFFRDAGYKYLAAGENLAMDFVSARDAQQAFMASPTHRANVMNVNYTEVGIAVGQGEMNGRPAILIVEHFGKPARTKSAAPAAVAVSARVEKPKASASAAPLKTAETASAPAIASGTSGRTLGSETDSGVTAEDARVPAVSAITFNALAKVLSAVLMFVIAISLAFFVMRSNSIHPGLAMQALVLLAVFGAVLVFGVPTARADRITSIAAFTLVQDAD